MRNYKKKTVPKYNQNDLKVAINNVKSKQCTVYSASKLYNIPKSTLLRCCGDVEPGRHGSGGITVLSKDEEDLIATALNFLAKCGYAQTRRELQVLYKSSLI